MQRHASATVELPTEAASGAGVTATRQKLLRAAAEEFGERGFQAATTRGIAHRAGVNEVTLFRHFRSRSDLLRATIIDAIQTEAEMVRNQPWDGGDLRGSVAHYARVYVGVVERRAALTRAIIGEGRLLPKDVQVAIIEAVQPLKAAMANWVRDSQRRGTIRPDVNPVCAVEVLRDALQSAVLRWAVFGATSSPPELYLETLVETFVRGVETPRPF